MVDRCWVGIGLPFLVAVVFLALLPNQAFSERLTDPSQPPGALFAPPPEIISDTPQSGPKSGPKPGNHKGHWRLQFVRLSEIGAIAIINDRVLKPGQDVDGFLLQEVRRNGVWGMAYHQKIWLQMSVDQEQAGMTLRRRDSLDD